MRVSHGLLPRELALIRTVFIRYPEVTGVILFGSRAKGTANPASDLDLALEGITGQLQAEAIASELDELPLPYRFDVKALAAIQSQPLREHIERVGVRIFESQEENEMSDLKQRIFELAKAPQLINLATITEEGKPWVRYVFGQADAELTFRFCTSLCSDKVRHIRHNANVHLSLGAKDLMTAKEWLQVVGTAEISTAQEERHGFWNDGFLAYFKGPDDPNYCVVIVKPSLIELAAMGSMAAEVWQAGK